MIEIDCWSVTEQTGEREFREIGKFATEILARYVASQKVGWYGAPRTVGRARVAVIESPEEWAEIEAKAAATRG